MPVSPEKCYGQESGHQIHSKFLVFSLCPEMFWLSEVWGQAAIWCWVEEHISEPSEPLGMLLTHTPLRAQVPHLGVMPEYF